MFPLVKVLSQVFFSRFITDVDGFFCFSHTHWSQRWCWWKTNDREESCALSNCISYVNASDHITTDISLSIVIFSLCSLYKNERKEKRKDELGLCFDNPLDHNRFFLTSVCVCVSIALQYMCVKNEKQNRVLRTHPSLSITISISGNFFFWFLNTSIDWHLIFLHLVI